MDIFKPALNFVKKNKEIILLILAICILVFVTFYYKNEGFTKELNELVVSSELEDTQTSHDLKDLTPEETNCPDNLDYPQIYNEQIVQPFDSSELENSRLDELYKLSDFNPQPTQ